MNAIPTNNPQANVQQNVIKVQAQQQKPLSTGPPTKNRASIIASTGSATISPFDLDPVPFPSVEQASRMQKDDLADDLLLTICSAFASVDNRALCPKEIAAVCMKLGWKCNTSQPFAIVSSCIRSHLRRRGMTATNSSNGRPFGPKLPPPLFASYELAGIPEPVDVLAMGIDKDAKPAVKRGTLWYLSTEGTGYPSPFGERDPNLPENEAKLAAMPKIKTAAAVQRKIPLPTSQSLPNMSAFPVQPVRQISPYYDDEEGDAMGRGKRKRKASSIAGGDASWQVNNKNNAANSASVSPPPLSSASSHRRAGSTDSIPRQSLPPSDRNASGIKRIRVRLSALSESLPATFDSALESDDDQLDDPSAVLSTTHVDPGQLLAQEKRRTKKRSKSEGSLLSSFNPMAMYHKQPTSINGDEDETEQEEEDGNHATRSWSAEPVSRFRPPTLLNSLVGRRLQGDVEMRPVDETDDEEDDFHEAILKSNFDFEFDFAFDQRKLAAARRKLELVNSGLSIDDMELLLAEDGQEDLDTPATTPRSPILDDAGNPEFYDLANEAAKKAEAEGVKEEMILLGLEEASNAVQETLAEAISPQALLPITFDENIISPALPVPPLPIVKAVTSVGFGPAGTAPEEEEDLEADSLSSSFSEFDTLHAFANPRSFSPAASSISSFNGESELPSQAASPACSSDSFDAEVVTGGAQERFEKVETSMSPSTLGMEDLVTIEDAQGEENLHITLPTDVAMDELDLEFGGPVTPPLEWPVQGATPPPTPFGPEVYGFYSAPQMEWHAPAVVTPLCAVEDSAIGLELGPGLEEAEDVEMDGDEKLRSDLLRAVEMPAASEVEDTEKSTVNAKESEKSTDKLEKPAVIEQVMASPKSVPAKPVLQRKTSLTQPSDVKLMQIKSQEVATPAKAKEVVKPAKSASTRSTRSNPQPVEIATPEQPVKPIIRRSSRKK